MLPIKKILAAVQVDSDSNAVVDFAGDLAKWNQAELELIHIFETPGYGGPKDLAWIDGQIQHSEGELGPWRSAQAMARMLERCGPLGLPSLQGRMVYGMVESTLVEWVHRGGFGLVVIGNHPHSKIERMLSGDVARELVKTCPCPLLIVPHY